MLEIFKDLSTVKHTLRIKNKLVEGANRFKYVCSYNRFIGLFADDNNKVCM